jgi:ribose transport system ATP-binding protein
VSIQNPQKAKLYGISTIYQDFSLIPHLTVAQNIFLGREMMVRGAPFFLDNKATVEKCQILLESLRLPLNAREYVGNLSTAEKQLVEISRALSTKCKILIMDEPTSTLTPNEIEQLFDMVSRLRNQGVGIIYISHRLEEAKRLGDRVTVLRDGNYVGTFAVNETSVDRLINLMVGEEINERFPKAKIGKGREILKIEGFSKPPFFKEVTFSLREKEILGIAGLLGSGKDRLLRAIGGVERPIKGGLTIQGKVMRISSCQDAIRSGISYLLQTERGRVYCQRCP